MPIIYQMWVFWVLFTENAQLILGSKIWGLHQNVTKTFFSVLTEPDFTI